MVLDYVDDLMTEAFALNEDTEPEQQPAPMTHMYERPADEAAAKSQYRSRFST